MIDLSSYSSNEEVQLLFLAYYGRPSDPGGRSYWASQLDGNGRDVSAIVPSFATSQEFQDRYGSLDTGGLVDTAYQQLFGRAPDTAGRAWYVGEIQAGRITFNNFVLNMLTGAQNEDITVIQNRLVGADTFSAAIATDPSKYAGSAAATSASSLIASITASAGSLNTFNSTLTRLLSDWGTTPDVTHEVGQTLSGVTGEYVGNINQAGVVDKIPVTLTAGTTYRIQQQTAAGSPIDPSIIGIAGPDGTAISGMSNNDTGPSHNAELNFTPTSTGTYTVTVGSHNSSVGLYWFGVRDVSLSPSTTTAGSAVVGTGYSGSIGAAFVHGKIDVSLVSGQDYSIVLTGGAGGNVLDAPTIYQILDPDGKIAANSYAADDHGQAQLGFTATQDGTYQIFVGDSYADTGNYSLSVSNAQKSLGASSRPIDDYPEAIFSDHVTVGGSTTGDISTSGEVDFFTVTLQAGHQYTIDLEGADTGRGTLSDPLIAGVTDASFTYVENSSDDDSGTGLNSRVIITAPTSGTYYIGAATMSLSTGWYTLSVTEGTEGGTAPVDNVDNSEPPVVAMPPVGAAPAAGDDFSSTISTTGHVTVGGSTTGNIETAGDTDWFHVTLQAGQHYTINLEGAPTSHGTLSDPYFNGVYDASGASISNTANDDDGDGYNSRMDFTATTSGTYYLCASGFSDHTGTYSISVTSAASITDDFSSTVATTGHVTAGGSTAGNIETDGDTDWFAVTLQAGQQYTINLEGSATGQGTLSDTYLHGVYDASGTLIENTANDDGGTGYNSRLTFTATAAGTYYVSAGAYGSLTGTYNLSVSDGTGVDDYLSAASTTGHVTVGGSTTGNIETANDTDWFAVTLTAGQQYVLDLEGSPTGQGTLSDTYLHGVYDASGTLIASTTDDDSGTGSNSHLLFTAPTSGMYYVSAGAYSSGTGTYKLSVTAGGDDFLSTTSTTGHVTVGGSTAGNIETANDTDWFAVTLTAGSLYTIDLSGAPSNHGTLDDTFIKGIYDSAGRLVSGTSNDDFGTTTESEVSYTPSSTGTYYIAAGAYGTHTGTYQLDVATSSGTPPPVQTGDTVGQTTGTAGAITLSQALTGRIDTAGDQDWYSVSLAAGTYDINLQGLDHSAGTLADPLLDGVYDSSGRLISGTGNDDSGRSADSYIQFSTTTGATYYIAAAAYGTNTGTYSLMVTPVTSTVDTTPPPPSSGASDWTIMAYVDADNNLEDAGLTDVNEMEAAQFGSGIQVTLQLDRKPGESSADGNWTGTRRGVIQHDSNTNHISSLSADIGEQNMGNPAALTSFINWSVTTAPATHTALILWNHGGGINGVALDDTSGGDILSLHDIVTGIQNSSVAHFDVVGFDACLMAELDMAYILRNVADVMIASEKTEPGDGWDYTPWLNGFSAASSKTAEVMGSQIVQTYDAFYQSPQTLSTLRLTQVDNVTSAMHSFATAWQSSGQSTAVLAMARSDAHKFSNDYVDLYDFMDKVSTRSTSAAVDSAAQAVMTAVTGMVASNGGGTTGAHGLTVYMPVTADSDYLSSAGELIGVTGWASIYAALWA